jgi:hypothetical protein
MDMPIRIGSAAFAAFGAMHGMISAPMAISATARALAQKLRIGALLPCLPFGRSAAPRFIFKQY